MTKISWSRQHDLSCILQPLRDPDLHMQWSGGGVGSNVGIRQHPWAAQLTARLESTMSTMSTNIKAQLRQHHWEAQLTSSQHLVHQKLMPLLKWSFELLRPRLWYKLQIAITEMCEQIAKATGRLKKNFLLPNLAFANIAIDGEKSNNSVLTNPVVLYLLS